MTLSFQVIDKAHDRRDFDCGKEPLNQFLRETARRNEGTITSTRVLVDLNAETTIIGFHTLTYCEVDAPLKSPLNKYPHPLQGMKLARMAVDTRFSGNGYGVMILVDAIKRTCHAHEIAPLLGLFVDSKDQDAKRFYEKYGFNAVNDEELYLWLPIQDCLEVGKSL
jgi:GNAT superfamily N-acetyltransferase